jgi:hypothetical protein
MNTPLIRSAAWLLAWLPTLLLAGGALAEETAGPPAATPPVATAASAAPEVIARPGTSAATLGFALLPTRFRHTATPAVASTSADAGDAEPAIGSMDYRDRAPLITRLQELDGLRLLTFWETRAFAVFFGVSREGIAGLNIAQKKDGPAERDDEESGPEDPAPEPTYLAASIYRR